MQIGLRSFIYQPKPDNNEAKKNSSDDHKLSSEEEAIKAMQDGLKKMKDDELRDELNKRDFDVFG